MSKRAHDNLSCAVWVSIHILSPKTPTLPLSQVLLGRLIILLGASACSLSIAIPLCGLPFIVTEGGDSCGYRADLDAVSVLELKRIILSPFIHLGDLFQY